MQKSKTIAKSAKIRRNFAQTPRFIEKIRDKLKETVVSLGPEPEITRFFEEMHEKFTRNEEETPKIQEILAKELEIDNSLLDCLKSINKISLILKEKALKKGVLL